MALELLKITKSEPAHLLVSYFATQNILATIVKRDNAFVIVLENDSDQEKASAIVKEFLHAPYAEKFQQAAWQSDVSVESSNKAFDFVNIREAIQFKKQWFMVLLSLSCIAVFAYLKFDAINNQTDITGAIINVGFMPLRFEHFEWWRLFAHNFMHGNFMHLTFNLIWWWIFGGQIERTFGTSSLIILFIFASVVANLAQLLLQGPYFIGLSGVVYCLFGFVWWLGWLRPSWGVSIPRGFVIFLLIWMILGFLGLFSMQTPFAHPIGLFSGCFLALMFHVGAPKSKEDKNLD